MRNFDDGAIELDELPERHHVPQRRQEPGEDIGWRNVGEQRIILDHRYRVDGKDELVLIVCVRHDGHEGVREDSDQDCHNQEMTDE